MYLPPIIATLLPFLLPHHQQQHHAQIQPTLQAPDVAASESTSSSSSASAALSSAAAAASTTTHHHHHVLSFRPAHAHATRQDASRQLLFHDGSDASSSSSSSGRRHRQQHQHQHRVVWSIDGASMTTTTRSGGRRRHRSSQDGVKAGSSSSRAAAGALYDPSEDVSLHHNQPSSSSSSSSSSSIDVQWLDGDSDSDIDEDGDEDEDEDDDDEENRGQGPPLIIRTARKKVLRPLVTKTRTTTRPSLADEEEQSRNSDGDRAWFRQPGLLEYGRASRLRQASSSASSFELLEADSWSVEWVEEEQDVPDVSDRETLIALAKMTSNAYTLPTSTDWYPLDEDGFNRTHTVPFGWDKDADGLRGHVFIDEQNTTAIISIKGTSAGVLGSGGPTAKNDKFNDNLLFSCCCARVDFSWSPVCDCFAGGYKCEQKCLEEALLEESVYTSVGPNLYHNVTRLYPNASIWLVGHSLGGSLASLLGLSYGRPAVTFEAPGERLAASRLHLPLPPEKKKKKRPDRNSTTSDNHEDDSPARVAITHVYHNADPIPMGVCNGPYSGCYALGFAMESRCHTGQSIIYDMIGRKGWSVDIRTHRIGEVINRVLDEDWDPPPNDTSARRGVSSVERGGAREEASWWPWWPRGNGTTTKPNGTEPADPPPEPTGRNPNAVPRPEDEDDCVDCFRWEFGNGMKKDPTTTSTISVTVGGGGYHQPTSSSSTTSTLTMAAPPAALTASAMARAPQASKP